MAANTGRPSDYLVEVADDICSLLASGESLNSICKRKGFPSRNTVYRWLREYKDFRYNYARATDDRADSIFEEMLDIADGAEEETASIAKARLQIDARKWILGKMNPKKFSDKQSVEHSGPNGGDINVTITRRVID
ncbi:MAG: hypothetical protein ACEQSA_06415 [Weeksellaceae bacterium]